MPYDRGRILEFYQQDDVESMVDKHLLSAEIDLIRRRIPPNSLVLDAGCGEGEGTLVYAQVPGVIVHAADFSGTRLKKAAQRLAGRSNVLLKKIDFLEKNPLDQDYDVIVSQRFLINITDWSLQQQVLKVLVAHLKPQGKLLVSEGCRNEADALNGVRSLWGLKPIPDRWNNLFFDNDSLLGFMESLGCRLVEEDGLGTYYFLTRGIRPIFEPDPDWKDDFNRMAATREVADRIGFGARFARLKLWVFSKT